MTPQGHTPDKDVHKLSRRLVWAGAAIGLLILLVVIGLTIRFILQVNKEPPKQRVQQITLVKPPPPKIEEKPPEIKEPEIKPKEVEIEKPEIDEPKDIEPPPGDLGVDADASGGGDGFGLQARKGGASLIDGAHGSGMYNWYTNRYASEIQRHFNEIVSRMGGLNGKGLKTIIRVDVELDGSIRGSIIGSSGDPKMDEAVIQAINRVTLREPPPAGMPRAMKMGIMSQG